jgi:hypothetical protein
VTSAGSPGGTGGAEDAAEALALWHFGKSSVGFEDMARMIDGHYVYYDDGTPETVVPELPTPPHLTPDQAENVGWVIDRFDGRTRPSTKYPSGQCRWVSKPERPVSLEAAVAELARRKKEHREQWEEDGGGGVYDPPTYRIRNVYKGDVLMGAIL